jgi:protein-disulfide isomerase
LPTDDDMKVRWQPRARPRHIPSRYAQTCIVAWLLAVFLAALTSTASAQAVDDMPSLKKEIDSLQQGQKEIQKELEAIRALLTPPDRPIPTSLDLTANDSPFRGEMDAKIALVEYFDYQCPFCARFFDETMPQVLTDYIRNGKVKFIVRDFPLDSAHPHALQAAEAAHCANDQGKFWQMHDALMGNSDALDRPKLSIYAQDVGLDLATFDKCVDSSKYVAKIKESTAGGIKAGVDGTPTFFLGVTDASGQKIVSLQRLEGAIPFPKLKEAIDKLLAQQSPPATPAAAH